MKIILITRDRPELTIQTIKTLRENAADWGRHTLQVVVDGTTAERQQFEEAARKLNAPLFGLIHTGIQLGVGGAKNFGSNYLCPVYTDPYTPGTPQPNEIIMFTDNDMYYLPNWDKRLEDAFHHDITQLGGWKHPYHAIEGWAENLDSEGSEALVGVGAVTGNCFVIRYKDWLKFGPFDSNALGPGQSEDYALSTKIAVTGGIIAALDPPVAIHCGLRNSSGEPAVGWEAMAVMAEKQIREHGIRKIWLEVPEEGAIQLERNLDRTTRNFLGLNIGSGQRRFDNAVGWINVDRVSRPPDQVPDLVLDANHLTDKFLPSSVDMVVLHHVLEHFGCGEADEILRQCYNVVKPGGSLLLFVPDLQRLAERWLRGEISDYIFMVNTYGAYQGEEGDRHRWGYTESGLAAYLKTGLRLPGTVRSFDWRNIPGADIARDWWIAGVELVK